MVYFCVFWGDTTTHIKLKSNGDLLTNFSLIDMGQSKTLFWK